MSLQVVLKEYVSSAILTQGVWAELYADRYSLEKWSIFSKIYSCNRLRSKFDGRYILVDVLQEWSGTPAEQAQKRKEFADVSQNLKKSLTGLKIGRDTRTWLENRRKGLRGGIGTDERRKAVKEIGREKRKNLMKQSKNRHWKEKDKKRRSRNRAKMLAKSKASGLKKRSYWTSAMAWLQ